MVEPSESNYDLLGHKRSRSSVDASEPREVTKRVPSSVHEGVPTNHSLVDISRECPATSHEPPVETREVLNASQAAPVEARDVAEPDQTLQVNRVSTTNLHPPPPIPPPETLQVANASEASWCS